MFKTQKKSALGLQVELTIQDQDGCRQRICPGKANTLFSWFTCFFLGGGERFQNQLAHTRKIGVTPRL